MAKQAAAKSGNGGAKVKREKGPSLVSHLLKDNKGLRIGTFHSGLSGKYIVRVNFFPAGFAGVGQVTTKAGKIRRARAENESGTYAGAVPYNTFEEAADKARELIDGKVASGWQPTRIGQSRMPAFNLEDLE